MSARCIHCDGEIRNVQVIVGKVAHANVRDCLDAIHDVAIHAASDVVDHFGGDGVALYREVSREWAGENPVGYRMSTVHAARAVFEHGRWMGIYDVERDVNAWLAAGLAECEQLRAALAARTTEGT